MAYDNDGWWWWWDNEVSLKDVYPQIVEASQVCKATVVMTSKVDPCLVEPRRPTTGSYNWFSAQLAASVALSVLVLYGHISAARTQFEQHYSGSVVAETLIIHWCYIEGCCNNPTGMSLILGKARIPCACVNWNLVSTGCNNTGLRGLD